MPKRILSLFRNLFRKRAVEQELDDELRSSVEVLTKEKMKDGVSQSVARREALIELGGIEQVKEEVRAVRAGRILEDCGRDLRYAFRTLAKSPSFTAVAVLTLALGIGANTTIFSVVDWLLLRPLPVTNAGQLVSLASQNAEGYSNGFSYPDYEDIGRQTNTVFSEAAGVVPIGEDGISTGSQNETIWTSFVTGNFFEMMGVRPTVGNFIVPTSERSPDATPVMVLGYSFWKTHFGGDPKVIGKSALINGHPVTIIGVAPEGFHGVIPALDIQGYLSLGMASVLGDLGRNFTTDRKDQSVIIVARLRPGVNLSETQPVLSVIARRISSQYPATDKWISLRAYALGPLGPQADPSSQGQAWTLFAFFLLLSAVVLILACLNVANILLARALTREHEMALRSALGAGRGRLLRQLLTESLLLALLGGAGGIALGLAGSRALASINLRTSIPLLLDFQFDWRVFAFAFGMAVSAVWLIGVVPALRSTRANLGGLLHEGGRTATADHHRLRNALVVAQVGGSLMLLIVSGLFARSLEMAQHVDLGFNPQHVLNFSIEPREAGYDKARASAFLQDLLPRVRALPGVETASLAATVPMGYYSYTRDLRIEGYQQRAGEGAPSAGYNAVSSDYFRTMGIPIFSGRGISDEDTEGSQRVAVINQAMAEKYWHGENPLGRDFTTTDDPKDSIKVIAVVKNSRTNHISGPLGPYMYVSLAQNYQTPVTLQVRTRLPSPAMNREVMGVIHSLASTLPVVDIQTMGQALDTLNGLMPFELGAGLAATLGFLGLALAIVGVYGVVSYNASQRTHEIGIRLALGARHGQILTMVLRQGMLLIAVGWVVGVILAFGIARLVRQFLVGVSSTDPLTFITVSLLMIAVALLASYIPARRATKVDPMVALRYE